MHVLRRLLLLHVLTCFGQNVLGGKIINGEKVPENSMRYMVSLQTDKGKHVCGGFLINDQFVMTAAHCYDDSPTQVVVGTHDLRKACSDKVRCIKERHIHPSYKTVGGGDDIMILKLSKKVQLDNSIQTIQLPRSDVDLGVNEICCVAGWGKTKSFGPTVEELRAVNVSVIDQRVCTENWHKLPEKVICGGGFKTKNGFCQGDSGGPLVCRGFAFGVVSFNHMANCDYPDFPNVYTDIRKYIPWIQSIIP